MRCLPLVFSFLAIAATHVQGKLVPTCLYHQPRPQDAAPGNGISQALHRVLSTPTNGPCSGKFPTLPNGSVNNQAQRSNGSLILEITRDNSSVQIDSSCVKAFTAIIHDCVGNGPYWGGNLSVNGAKYAIYNKAYPKNWTPALPRTSRSDGLRKETKLVSATHRPSRLLPHVSHKPISTSATPGKPVHGHGSVSVHSSRPGPSTLQPPISATATPKAKLQVTIGSKSESFKTQTLSGVTGAPGSFSQIKTTNDNGHTTVLPIWFGPLGAAILVAPVGLSFPGIIPAPLGYPELSIGPDGQASRAQSHSHAPRASPTTSDRHITRSSPTLSALSSRLSSSRSTSSSSRSSSSRPTASATAVEYMIFPNDGENPENGNLTSELEAVFGSSLHTSQNHLIGVVFWSAPMSEAQKVHYDSNPVVSTVLPVMTVTEPCPSPSGTPRPQRRATTDKGRHRIKQKSSHSNGQSRRQANDYGFQLFAPQDLKILSQPPGAGSQNFLTYFYDPIAGAGSTIYIFDSGANPANPDYADMPNIPKWIYVSSQADENDPQNSDDTETDPTGHGTCVVSKAAGAIYGVAKNADVVVVKRPNESLILCGAFLSNRVVFEAFNLIADDIAAKNSGKAVVNLSFVFRDDGKFEFFEFIAGLHTLMERMIKKGVIIVCTAGNEADFAGHGDVDTFPALFAETLPIIVVGSSDFDGFTSEFSQGGDFVTVLAPGNDIQCADNPGVGSVTKSGTSFAAGTVSGLAAYLLSVPKYHAQLFGDGDIAQLPLNMIDLIKSLAYIRGVGTEPIVWNGEGLRDDAWPSPLPTEALASSSAPAATSRPPAILPTSSPSIPQPSPTSVSTPTNQGTDPGSVFDINCRMCEITCIVWTGRCTNPCLVRSSAAAAAECAPCLTDAGASKNCTECVPKCPQSTEGGGNDCTDKDFFTTCNGINSPANGEYGAPGLCTQQGYAHQESFEDPNGGQCPAGTVCDLGVAGTKNCLPAQPLTGPD